MSTATLTRAAAPTDANWRLSGRCLTVDPDLMHPADTDRWGQEQAKAICRPCPVKAKCLADAIRTRDWNGVCAGLTGAERREQYGRNLDTCRQCGGAYTSRGQNQKNCPPCAQAIKANRGQR